MFNRLLILVAPFLLCFSTVCFGAKNNVGGMYLLLNAEVSLDCNGDENGTAYRDVCGDCVGGNTGLDACAKIVTSEGQIWLDRNLGASQVATSMTDSAAYGDLYQWGRGADGHEIRTSGTILELSNSYNPGHGSFIAGPFSPYDWLSPQNDDLWQGVSGINTPCPDGFRLPTEEEWQTELQSWSSNDSTGAYNSPLKLVLAGYRVNRDGSLDDSAGSYGYYWSSTVKVTDQGNANSILYFDSYIDRASLHNYEHSFGMSVRCIKN